MLKKTTLTGAVIALFSLCALAQTPGLIFEPATGPGAAELPTVVNEKE